MDDESENNVDVSMSSEVPLRLRLQRRMRTVDVHVAVSKELMKNLGPSSASSSSVEISSSSSSSSSQSRPKSILLVSPMHSLDRSVPVLVSSLSHETSSMHRHMQSNSKSSQLIDLTSPEPEPTFKKSRHSSSATPIVLNLQIPSSPWTAGTTINWDDDQPRRERQSLHSRDNLVVRMQGVGDNVVGNDGLNSSSYKIASKSKKESSDQNRCRINGGSVLNPLSVRLLQSRLDLLGGECDDESEDLRSGEPLNPVSVRLLQDRLALLGGEENYESEPDHDNNSSKVLSAPLLQSRLDLLGAEIGFDPLEINEVSDNLGRQSGVCGTNDVELPDEHGIMLENALSSAFLVDYCEYDSASEIATDWDAGNLVTIGARKSICSTEKSRQVLVANDQFTSLIIEPTPENNFANYPDSPESPYLAPDLEDFGYGYADMAAATCPTSPLKGEERRKPLKTKASSGNIETKKSRGRKKKESQVQNVSQASGMPVLSSSSNDSPSVETDIVGTTSTVSADTYLAFQSETFSLGNATTESDSNSHFEHCGVDSFEDLSLITDFTSWEITLMIDRREKDYQFIQSCLLGAGIHCEVSTLALGDFVWVGKPIERDGVGFGENSIMMDCIVERKTVADLASSIVDGRYLEQKMRLRSCHLRTKIYIVEGLSLSTNIPRGSRVNSASIRTAMVSTHLDFGINVIRTRGLDHTVATLLSLHRRVKQRFQRLYGERSLSHFLTFAKFQSKYGKVSIDTVGQLFCHQLKQIPGCSSACTLGLYAKFGTFKAMLEWMQSKLLADAVREIAIVRKVGCAQVIGTKVAELICRVFKNNY